MVGPILATSPAVAPFLAVSSRRGRQLSVREDVGTGEHACLYVIPHAHLHGCRRGGGGW